MVLSSWVTRTKTFDLIVVFIVTVEGGGVLHVMAHFEKPGCLRLSRVPMSLISSVQLKLKFKLTMAILKEQYFELKVIFHYSNQLDISTPS
jgi:hypothetical protein